MYLTTAQEQRIGEAIVASGLPIENFERKHFGNRRLPFCSIEYTKRRPYEFTITKCKPGELLGTYAEYLCSARPAEREDDEQEVPEAVRDFDGVIEHVARWARLIAEEENPVDAWAVFATPKKVPLLNNNDPFTPDQVEQIQVFLKTTEKKLLKHTTRKAKEIKDAIADLSAKVETSGRKVFVEEVIRFLGTLAATHVISQIDARAVWHDFLYLAEHGLGFVMENVSHLLP